ncbi:N-carbamoyl-L-amino acid hydrolase [Mesorhizobium metallidurans STM 2683]|uniref:N-carbamoyl-L-amino acid hydrolase n=2 Tax=Mesorhizobium metallidurans TaxID=489722 RepID=M5EQ03_9HYPH|nr:N-carbamoyl-L-amino acid hydrolase [Mesorhizobium metallidurans STM 2683]
MTVDGERLVRRLKELGAVGVDQDGRLTRLAATDADKAGRDLFVRWAKEAGLKVLVDRIGNIFAVYETPENSGTAPIMMGSHIDTVIDAGNFDGCYGVLAGLGIVETIMAEGIHLARPLVVAAFTNEEGVRFTPDMMGSLVYVGGMDAEVALQAVSIDGKLLGYELERIGYAGKLDPELPAPEAYVELHIEQGPVLESLGMQIGVVEDLQGISWQRITIDGVANHAGTTPMDLRRDAGYAAAKIMEFVHERAMEYNTEMVGTVGSVHFEPNAINVIPSRATLTVDLRSPKEERLLEAEAALAEELTSISNALGVTARSEILARTQPVQFCDDIVARIEQVAELRGFKSVRITSGAGHDAQMMARLCPTAMIFVPSAKGISHNPDEYTPDRDLINGAHVLLDVVTDLAGKH